MPDAMPDFPPDVFTQDPAAPPAPPVNRPSAAQIAYLLLHARVCADQKCTVPFGEFHRLLDDELRELHNRSLAQLSKTAAAVKGGK